MRINIIGLILVFKYSNEEVPQTMCTESHPFRYDEYKCASFSEMCFRKDDQCNRLLNACKQCPPSNITLTILQDLLKFSQFQSKSAKQIITELQLNKTQQFIENKMNAAILTGKFILLEWFVFLLLMIIIIFLILFLDIRFKIITKCIQRYLKRDHSRYIILRSRKLCDQLEFRTEMKEELKELSLKVELILNALQGQNAFSHKYSKDFSFSTIQCQFDERDQESIEIYVHNNHNVVQVKQQICAKLSLIKQDDYKRMKLKYNGIILDDNEYLLKYINSTNTIINCAIDSTINANDIVVVKLFGKMRVPDVIQINKHQNIVQLIEMIGKIIDSKDFSVFKQWIESMKMEELKNGIINQYLKDGDWLRIITKEHGKLNIKSIFDNDVCIMSVYFNTDMVSSLTTSVANKFNSTAENFVLFCDNKYLNEEKYIFEYGINSESPVKFCCFMKWAGVEMDDEYIEKGYFSELHHGKFKITNKKITIKKYEVQSSKNWKNENFILNALVIFQITKSHRRFIQLLGVYNEEMSLYIVMENMTGGTMKTFLRRDNALGKNEMYKWAAQILEGLKFLHQHKVIHRDLNPSSILVDENNNLKLSSFNLSKYLDIYKPSSFMENRDKIIQLPIRYMAPEILCKENYGILCDVWSFGAVLIKIVTGKCPYSGLPKKDAQNKIVHSKTIEFNFSNEYSEFKSIIDSCLKSEPNLRETIDKLMENKYISKYIEN